MSCVFFLPTSATLFFFFTFSLVPRISSPIQRRVLKRNRSKHRSRRENFKFSFETIPFSPNFFSIYIVTKFRSFYRYFYHIYSFESRCQVIIEGSRINVKFARGWTNRSKEDSSRLWVFCGFLTADRER